MCSLTWSREKVLSHIIHWDWFLRAHSLPNQVNQIWKRELSSMKSEFGKNWYKGKPLLAVEAPTEFVERNVKGNTNLGQIGRGWDISEWKDPFFSTSLSQNSHDSLNSERTQVVITNFLHYYRSLSLWTDRHKTYKCLSLGHVWLFGTPWTVAHKAPPSMGFSRQEYWSGLPFPFPGDLPNSGIEPRSPVLQADSLPSEPPGKLDRPRFHEKAVWCLGPWSFE